MAEHTVREAVPGDVPAVHRIAEDAWRAAYGEFLPERVIESAMAEWYDPAVTRESIEDGDVGFFVAEAGEGVAGYASGGPGEEPDIATLGAINVDPDRWMEGIGSALLGRFEAFCRDRGLAVVRARVLAENEVGGPFYRARGYEAVAEREAELFGARVRERVFRKSLRDRAPPDAGRKTR